MSFNNLYTVLASVKHILTFTMVLIALIRSILSGRNDVTPNPKKNKVGMLLIILNLVLGLLILFISALLSAI